MLHQLLVLLEEMLHSGLWEGGEGRGGCEGREEQVIEGRGSDRGREDEVVVRMI